MKEIIIEEDSVSIGEKEARGRLEYDHDEYATTDHRLENYIKKYLKKNFNFEAAEVKVYQADCCGDGFTAKETIL